MAPPSLLLFLVSASVWVALLSLPLMILMPVAAADGQGGDEHCPPQLCGNVTISFPFGLIPEGADQTSCGGGSGFQVRCRNNTAPYLGYYQSEHSMQILSIFYDNRSLLIADRPPAYCNNTSPDHEGCRTPTADTSTRLAAPFSISSLNQNLIFYNCTTKPMPSPGAAELVETVCRDNTFVRAAADGRRPDESGGYVLEGCTATTVPVLGVSGEVNSSNYEQLVWDGFLATWQWPPPGEHCPPQLCGNVTISFPFGLIPEGADQTSCGGGSGFQVRCRNNTAPYLGYYQSEHSMQILSIFYDNRSLLIADRQRPAYFTRPRPGVCDIPTTNITSKLVPPLLVSTVNQNLIFYNCTKPPSPAGRGLVETVCQNNTFFRAADGRSDESPGSYFLEGCNAAMVPVLRVSGKVNASNYEQLVSDGFLVTWPPPSPSGGNNTRSKVVGIVCAVGGGSLLIAYFFFVCWHMRKQRKQARVPNSLMRSEYSNKCKTNLNFFLCKKITNATERNIEALILLHGTLAPKRYKYSEAIRITSALNNKLGEGGYGMVFKGRLDDGRIVAVKFLHESKGEGEEFVNEVMSIGRTSHVNIVSLFGFCLEGSKRALIYEYMPKGSLDKYIYSENPKAVLGWDKLYTIAVGIARGLEYLHHSCNTRIVHFDIKPQNILLDEDFHPKISDFGLAKLCHTKESKLSMTGARGTIGFIAPEVHSRTFGIVSTKSDVYSYGMMLLEMVGGRTNVKSFAQASSEKYFPHWIYDHFGQDDGLLACEVTHENEEIAKRMSLIGMWCIQILPSHCPTITKVLEMFERGLDELDMPPRQNFSQIFEDPAYNFNAENLSTSSGTKTL